MGQLDIWVSALKRHARTMVWGRGENLRRRMRLPRSLVASLRDDERGVVAIYVGLSLPVLVGSMGLGTEAAYWYWLQRELQHATDLATHAAATRRLYGGTEDDQRAAALATAKASGPSKLALADVVLHSPPKSGNYEVPSPHWAIEGIIQYQVPRLFTSIFSNDPVTVGARSVVISQANGTACVLALNKKKQGAIVVSGSADVAINGCWVATNSSANDASDFVGAKGALQTYCVRAVGTVDEGATSEHKGVETTQLTTKCSAPLEYAPYMEDPYSGRAPPTHTGTCPSTKPQVANGVTLHCSDWQPAGNVTGIHIFRNNAKLVVNNDISSGPAGVTFYFEGTSRAQINGNARLNLKAPSMDSDPTRGLLFWAAVGNTETMQINGNSSSTFEGAFYAPSGKVDWLGNGAADQGCIQIVADTVSFSGNNATNLDCSGSAPGGTTEIPTVFKVTLVE